MRIYKKNPYSAPNSVKVNELAQTCDRLDKTRSDLINLRNIVKEGKLTSELYDFINMDGSLDRLLIGLPRPVNEISCEALTESQLLYIDAAIESVTDDLKEVIKKIWEALKEWFYDWWDVNRHIRFELQSKRAKFVTSPSTYGDLRTFETIRGSVYHEKHWEKMIDKCKELNDIFVHHLSEVKQIGIVAWEQKYEKQIQECLAEFGQSIVYPGPKLVIESPKYDKNQNTLGGAQWKWQLLPQYATKAIDALGSDIDARRLIGDLEDIFLNASVEDKTALGFIRKLVMRSKANTFGMAEALRRIFRMAEVNATSATK